MHAGHPDVDVIHGANRVARSHVAVSLGSYQRRAVVANARCGHRSGSYCCTDQEEAGREVWHCASEPVANSGVHDGTSVLHPKPDDAYENS